MVQSHISSLPGGWYERRHCWTLGDGCLHHRHLVAGEVGLDYCVMVVYATGVNPEQKISANQKQHAHLGFTPRACCLFMGMSESGLIYGKLPGQVKAPVENGSGKNRASQPEGFCIAKRAATGSFQSSKLQRPRSVQPDIVGPKGLF